MNKSSFEKFNYALRPAKNIERKMLCEAFGRLPRIAPLSSYRYIGFGAVGFHDFILVHQRLGINDMTSIEGNLDAEQRVTKNKPYACIKMVWGTSHEKLPDFFWDKRTILWLDYEADLNTDQLKDLQFVAGNISSGSVLVVTLPAHPSSVDSNENAGDQRLNKLKNIVGEGAIPLGLKGKDLQQWGTAKIYRHIVLNKLLKTLADRNAPEPAEKRIAFHQLFNFHYKDGIKMMSFGGIFLDPSDADKLSPDHFADLVFYRPSEDPYLIDPPILTLRELRLLDESLPTGDLGLAFPDWIPKSERDKYAKIYRYFPSFSEVEM